MDRKFKSILVISLSLVLMLTMAFSAAGVAGIFGNSNVAVLGSDGDSEEQSEQAANPMTVKAKTVTIKFSKLKSKNQTVAAKKAFTVSDAEGKVTYTKKSGSSKIKVSSSGKITVKKGLKKGTYKVKVKVKAAGNDEYKSKSKTVTLKIKVK